MVLNVRGEVLVLKILMKWYFWWKQWKS